MEEPIEMDEVGRVNEGYDDDNNDNYDDLILLQKKQN